MADSEYDLIVVGLGAMGSAVTYHASLLGLHVLGIDRYDPPHGLGSTKAETRITRLAVGEGPQYLPFVRRSHAIWRELEAKTDVELLHECGGLIITEEVPVPGQRWEDFVMQTAAVATEGDIPFEIITPVEARSRYPWISVADDQRVGFEPTAGLVMVEKCVEVQLGLAHEHGAVIRTGEEVESIAPDSSGVTVNTAAGSHRAKDVVLSTGPWMEELAAPEHGRQLTVTRQVVYWFDVDDLSSFTTQAIPYVMWIAQRNEDYIGLFPMAPGGTPAVKILGEQFLETTDPSSVDRAVSQAEIDRFYDVHVASKFSGVRRDAVRAEVCLYVNTPDDHFLIDRDPRSERVTVMSPCSGHGFKHSTALGEAVAQRIASGRARGRGFIDGSSDNDLSAFRMR
ncbi:MAG: N-methyl-L-tryptophan oxidase [Acidimicrobiia bacterium]|nr:N-methyl-L-tryptophan oxidase [Acidimicrobiia bacterium]